MDVVDPTTLPDLDSPYVLDADAAANFASVGHALLPGLASAAEIAAYRGHLAVAAANANRERRPISDRDTYSAAFLQSFNLWRSDDVCRRFVFSPRFAKAAADLLGVSGVRLYHDQALFKEPGGGHTPWHQDQFYWPFDTEKTITMWMSLDDLDPRVGSMTFASASHTAG
ncbi:MAG TPA: phytanoyl-CoA dioxygenase family protein [Acidimicrobiia bacterium]|nr:phytanoyl-CoA dioxygenase family protein [Acidimicrobiia bacterium]